MDDLILFILFALAAVMNLILYRVLMETDLVYWNVSVTSIIIFILVFKILRLDTFYSSKGIHYRFFPFHRKEKNIPWDEIKQVEIIKYKPILDFGGYGIRYNFKSKAYIMQGNKALMIHFNEAKKPLLLGIKDSDSIHDALLKCGVGKKLIQASTKEN
ncbi:MAG: hypothetical protein WAT79_06665 [Saprospiraceae bacterium]